MRENRRIIIPKSFCKLYKAISTVWGTTHPQWVTSQQRAELGCRPVRRYPAVNLNGKTSAIASPAVIVRKTCHSIHLPGQQVRLSSWSAEFMDISVQDCRASAARIQQFSKLSSLYSQQYEDCIPKPKLPTLPPAIRSSKLTGTGQSGLRGRMPKSKILLSI